MRLLLHYSFPLPQFQSRLALLHQLFTVALLTQIDVCVLVCVGVWCVRVGVLGEGGGEREEGGVVAVVVWGGGGGGGGGVVWVWGRKGG